MAAGATYEPIATTTLASASGFSFTSIPATYTDLRLVITGKSAALDVGAIRFNSDTAANYSQTRLVGNGTSASTGQTTNSTYLINDSNGTFSSTPAFCIWDIFSYAGSTYKTCLQQWNSDANGSGIVSRRVGLWRSTSAINRIDSFALTLDAGSIITLYGIKAA